MNADSNWCNREYVGQLSLLAQRTGSACAPKPAADDLAEPMAVHHKQITERNSVSQARTVMKQRPALPAHSHNQRADVGRGVLQLEQLQVKATEVQDGVDLKSSK